MKYIYPILKRIHDFLCKLKTVHSKLWSLNSILFTVYCLLTTVNSHAQNFIHAQLNTMPPYSLYLSDYAIGTNIQLHLVQRDITREPQEVYLNIELEGAGIRLKTLPSFRPNSYIEVIPGAMLMLTNVDIAEYLDIHSFSFEGISMEAFNANGQQLPEGLYKLKVKAILKNTGSQASNEAMGLMAIQKGQPPIINLPINKSKVPENATQNFIINWTNRNPMHIGVPSYRIQMWEMLDPDQDPNIIVQGNYPPILDDYTNVSTYQYGLANTGLTAGKSYVLRVQVLDPEGRDVYANGGYSQVVRFIYGDPCEPPANLSATLDPRGIAVNWALTPNQGGYRLQYGRIDTAWTDADVFINRFQIEKTFPSAQYQMRVASYCGAGKQSNFSEIVYIGTKPSGSNNQAACGDPFTKIKITNNKLLPSLKVGDKFTSFDFDITVTRVVRNDSNSYAGEGKTPFNMFGGLDVVCHFDGITINTDRQHNNRVPVKFQQKPYVFSDKTFKQFKDDFNDTKERFTGDDAANAKEVKVDVTIGTVVYDSTRKRIVISDVQGKEIKTLESGKNYKITDKDGNVYLVSKDNQVSKQPKATESTVNGGGPQKGGGENFNIHFTEDQPVLSFASHPDQTYGFDAESMNSMGESLYESIINTSSAYYVPYKSISSAGTDRVIAKVDANPGSVDLKRIKFKTNTGITVPFVYDSLKQEWTLTITASHHRNDFSVFPYYGNGTDTLCGKLNVMPLDRKEINLVLIPLNGFNVMSLKANDIEGYLNKVYKQANIGYRVRMDSPFTSAAAAQPLSVEHGKFQGEYSNNQAQVISDYTAVHPEEDHTVYLFLCREGSNSTIKGHTPLNRSYGFLFGESIDHRTIAHEVGHGYPLALEHPFTDGGATGTYSNLMDYASGLNLSFKQWGGAHNPKLKVRFGQRSKEGQFLEEHVNMKAFLEWLKPAKGKPTEYRYANFVVKGVVVRLLPDEFDVTGTSPYTLQNACCNVLSSQIYYDKAHFGATLTLDALGKSQYTLTISLKDNGEEAFSISCQNYSDHELLLKYLGLQLSASQINTITNTYAKAINGTSGDCQRLFNLYAQAPPFLAGKIQDSKLFNDLYAFSKCTGISDLQSCAANALSFFSDPANCHKLLGAQTEMLLGLYSRHSSYSRWIYLRQLARLSNAVWAGQPFAGDKTERTYYQYPDAFIASTPRNGKLWLVGKYYNSQQPAYAGDSYATAYVGGDYGAMDRVFLVLPDMANASNSVEVSVPAIYCHGLSDEHVEARNFSAMMLIAEGGINSILTLLDAGALAKLPVKSKVFGAGVKSSTNDLYSFLAKLGNAWDENLKQALRYDLDGNAPLKTLFSKADDATKLEYANAWKALIKQPDLRKSPSTLGLLKDVRNRFTYNGKDGFMGFEEILRNHSDATLFIDNLKRVDPLFGKVPNIKYTATTSSTRVRIVDNDAIPFGYRPDKKGDLKATSLKDFKLVDQSNPELFTEEFLKSFEFDFKGLIIKAENIRLGGANKNKIAIIGKSMGGGMRKNPDTGIEDFAFGVTDYALKLRSMGFETRLFIRKQLDDLPYLTDEAVENLDELVKQKAIDLGVSPKSKDAYLSYNELKTKNSDKPVLALQLNMNWADALVDKGYTIIDIGNPNNISELSAFYDAERTAIFGK